MAQGFGTRFGTRFGTPLGTRYPADAAGYTLQQLQAVIGAAPYHLWNYSDSTQVTVVSGNASSVANLGNAGGGAMSQGTAGSRPAYSATGGCNNTGYVRVAAGKSMTGSASVSQGYYAWYAVMRQGLPIAAANAVPTYQDHAAGQSAFWARGSIGKYSVNGNFAGGANQVTIDLDPSILGSSGGSPFPDLARHLPKANEWTLRSLRYLAAGSVSQINGVTTTPNFANANQGNSFTQHKLGSGAAPVGDIAWEMIVTPTDATHAAAIDAAVDAYCRSRFSDMYTYDSLPLILSAGQSNSNANERKFTAWPGVTGYTTKICSRDATSLAVFWASGGAPWNQLMSMAAAVPASQWLVLNWNQGESDSINLSDANAHAGRQAALFTAVRNAHGAKTFIIDHTFHATFLTNPSYPNATVVDNGKRAGTGADVLIDVNTVSGGGGLRADLTHYDDTLNFNVFAADAAACPAANS